MPENWLEMDLSGDFMIFYGGPESKDSEIVFGQEKDGENDGDLGEHLGGKHEGVLSGTSSKTMSHYQAGYFNNVKSP